MLKTCGNIYSQSQEEMEEMHGAMAAAGYDFAYLNPLSATIVKKVVSLEENNNGQSEPAEN